MITESIKTLLTSHKEQLDSEESSRKVIKMEHQTCKNEKGLTPRDGHVNKVSVVSFISDIPAPLKASMEAFIESHPNWDQYRFIQAAVARFLIQQGIESSLITRLYVENVFPQKLSKREML